MPPKRMNRGKINKFWFIKSQDWDILSFEIPKMEGYINKNKDYIL